MSLVYVGYSISVTPELVEALSAFEGITVPEQLTLAIMHKHSDSWRNSRNDTNADEETMRQWVSKAKTTTGFLQAVYYRKTSRNPPKNTKIDIVIVGRISIDGKPFYVNIFNNSQEKPIDVKKLLCANEKAFNEISIDRIQVECVPIKHEN